MPFDRNKFITEYSLGDLFYGLAKPRDALRDRIVPKQFRSAAFGTIINQYDIGDLHNGAELPEEQPSFAKHMAGHQAYSESFRSNQVARGGVSAENWKLWRRKSKAGLSWATSSQDKFVHFCLDGYEEYYSTVTKSFEEETNNELKNVPFFEKTRSITNAELRWIYRNRNNPAVAETIQFWRNNKPCTPPWEGHAASGKENEPYQDPHGDHETWELYKPTKLVHIANDEPYGNEPFDRELIVGHLYPIMEE